ncbi:MULTISPECIES: DUF2732 family protein [Arsenophonus]|uniref:DUF2732 family protein n=1 Tax=Arsenophonus TaxID=637 RepID=UPI0015D80BDB|nr:MULTISPECIES: DUF2732 family protein [Arsenophonus]UBX30112.1 DUF2732 family protein [Arsenophonus apicola]
MTAQFGVLKLTDMLKQNREDERKHLLRQFSAHLTSLAYQILHQKMSYHTAYQHVVEISHHFELRAENLHHV